METWSVHMESYQNCQEAFHASGIWAVLPSAAASEPAPK